MTVALGLLAVVNAAAGAVDVETVEPALAVLRGGGEVEVAATVTLAELGGALAGSDGRRVVVFGGDGSLHVVVQALYEAGRLDPLKPLGLVPLGTGNDLARALGIPPEPAAAAEVVLRGRVRPLDLAVDDTGTVLVNAAHVGIGAEAARRAETWKPALGDAAYPLGAVLAGVTTTGFAVTVEVDGTVVHRPDNPVLMVGVANGRTIGGGTPLAPDAAPDDGLLDVVVAAATGPLDRAGYAVAMRGGDHVDRDDVAVYRGRQVTVRAAVGESFGVDADGEVSTDVVSRSWTIHRHRWALLVADDGEAR